MKMSTIMSMMVKVKKVKTCINCVLDGTDACTRGAGRAINDKACEDFLGKETKRRQRNYE